MKTKYTLLIMLITALSFAQNGINYKAVIKDNSGNVIANQNITLHFSILKGVVAQTNVYSETHPITTDNNGIAIVNIGEGTLVGSSPAFTTINWGSEYHFLNVKVTIGGVLTNMGTTQFKAVPYALSSSDNQWIVNGNSISNKNTGNIGIGENNPLSKLDINGDLRLQLGTSVNEFSTDGDLTGNSLTAIPTERAVKSYVDNNTFWSPTGSNIRNINTGNVGVGETNPTAKLHISKGFGSTPFLELESQSGDRANLRFSKNGSNDFWDQIAGIRTDAASGTLSYYYSNNHIMTLRGNGKVGINNFDPQDALDVVGDINTSGEVHSTSTGEANLVPIAYGNVARDGHVYTSTGNVSVIRTGIGTYIITIAGQNFSHLSYITMLNVNERFAGNVNSSSGAGKLEVYTSHPSGYESDRAFTFVIYKR